MIFRLAFRRSVLLGWLAISCHAPDSSAGKTIPLSTRTNAPEAAPKKEEPLPLEQAMELAKEIRSGRSTLASSTAALVDARYKKIRKAAREHDRFERVLRKLYKASDNNCYFFDERELRFESFPELLAFIDALPAHAINTKPYQRELLLESFSDYEDARDKEEKATATLKGITEETARLTYLEKLLYLSTDIPANLEEALIKRGLINDDVPTLKAIIAALETQAEARAKTDAAGVVLDLRMLRATMQAVLDFRYIKRAHPFLSLTYPDRAPDYYADNLLRIFIPELLPEPEDEKKIIEVARTADTPDPRINLGGFLAEQIPTFPLYHQMVKELAFYQNLSEASEEDKPTHISRRALHTKLGSRGPEIGKLRQRLIYEGYLPADQEITQLFDKSLQHALKYYQTTHQLETHGILDNLTRGSLNRSMRYRAKQLKLGLQRYRESKINEHRPPVFLRVNVPEFKVELWRNGTLVKKHKVVVGNNNWEEDHRRKIVGFLNRTALFEATVQNIVVNPYWRVPKRIKTFELDEALLDSPDFYERNRYEIQTSNTGEETVRQMPGAENALGRVKINFPNPHAIFMHDTPHKALFDKVFRAFSHGCMRLHEPLDMVQFILQQDQEINLDRFQEILDSYEETSLGLRTPIPIYVEYNVTTVDEHGKAGFLSDIYRYDLAYYNRELPAVNEFELEAFKAGEKVPFEGSVARNRGL